MKLFRDFRNFLRKEPVWSFLFLILLMLYAFYLYRPEVGGEKPVSDAFEEMRHAETLLKEKVEKSGGIQEFLKYHPRFLWAFNLFTLAILAAFLIGLFLDSLWLLRPDFRRRFEAGGEGPPEARSWSLGSVFKVIVIFVYFSLGLGLFLSLLRSRFLPELSSNSLSLFHTTVSDVVVFMLLLCFVQRKGGSWRDLGFRKVNLWEDLKMGLAGYLAVLPVFIGVLLAVALLAYFFNYEPPPHPLVEIFLEEEKRSPLTVLYSVFLACVAGPFFEEIFFRGFCYPAFKKRWGTPWALFLSSAFFSLIHQNAFAFAPILVLGFGLAYLYEKRGTLLPSLVLHIVHNTVFIGYFFLAKKLLLET